MDSDRRFFEADPEEVKRWVDAGEAELIDIRELPEWHQGKIPGAILKPMSSFDPAGIDGKADKVGVFYCRSGGRTWNMQDAFMETAYGKVCHLRGGIIAWARAGYPIEEPPDA